MYPEGPGERREMKRRTMITAFAIACAAALAPRAASAFCGFFVASGGARLYNHASQVVLMREGIRTVLSMSNDYQGPPEGFALVVPVPVVLQKSNVKTLSRELFERVDSSMLRGSSSTGSRIPAGKTRATATSSPTTPSRPAGSAPTTPRSDFDPRPRPCGS
jgi:hypothetical protein